MGIMDLGSVSVRGRIRVPSPPARITNGTDLDRGDWGFMARENGRKCSLIQQLLAGESGSLESLRSYLLRWRRFLARKLKLLRNSSPVDHHFWLGFIGRL